MENQVGQIPVGVQEQSQHCQPQPNSVPSNGSGWRTSFLVTVLIILCLFGVFLVVRFVRYADQTSGRIDLLELKGKVEQLQGRVVELEKIRSVQEQVLGNIGQRLDGMAVNHNKLVQAIETVINQHQARLEVLEKKESPKAEDVKPEAEKSVDKKEAKRK